MFHANSIAFIGFSTDESPVFATLCRFKFEKVVLVFNIDASFVVHQLRIVRRVLNGLVVRNVSVGGLIVCIQSKPVLVVVLVYFAFHLE